VTRKDHYEQSISTLAALAYRFVEFPAFIGMDGAPCSSRMASAAAPRGDFPQIRGWLLAHFQNAKAII